MRDLMSFFTNCCKKVEVDDDDQTFRKTNGAMSDLAEYRSQGAAKMLDNYKLVQHLPPISAAFKDH
jgi:hypothetical protein